MDTSETYIKMCEKAEEIQKEHEWEEGNWSITKAGELEVESGYFNYFESEFLIGTEARKYDCAIWLPRQDQLQLLYRGIYNEQNAPLMYDLAVLRSFIWDENDKTVPYFRKFTSMEQLWLAFVMKEKYDKVWDRNDWVRGS